jgi:hypothetical protein
MTMSEESNNELKYILQDTILTANCLPVKIPYAKLSPGTRFV